MEFCSVEILRPKAKKIVVWSIYRPPSGNIDKFMDERNGSLENISDRNEVLLLGDFNISWNSKSVKCKLVNLANAYGLEQIVDQPTRVTEPSSSLIDLIFTNTIHRIKDHGVVDLSLSDNSMVYCVVKAGISKAPGKTIEYRSYKHYQKNDFIQDLSVANWSDVDNEPDVDSAVLAWNKLFSCIANNHAPLKTARMKGTKSPWMTTQLTEAMQKRDFYHRKAKQSNCSGYWTLYQQPRNFVNAEVKRCKSEYYTRTIKENKQNHSALWKTLNEITSRKGNTPVSCIEGDGVLYTDHASIASIMNKHFLTVATMLTQRIKSSIGTSILPR